MLFLRLAFASCGLLLVLVAGASPSLSLHPPRLTVSLLAYPMSTSTLIAVDKDQIHSDSPLDTVLKRPARCVRELQAGLDHKDTVSWQAFRPGFMRFWFHVSGPITSYGLFLALGPRSCMGVGSTA